MWLYGIASGGAAQFLSSERHAEGFSSPTRTILQAGHLLLLTTMTVNLLAEQVFPGFVLFKQVVFFATPFILLHNAFHMDEEWDAFPDANAFYKAGVVVAAVALSLFGGMEVGVPLLLTIGFNYLADAGHLGQSGQQIASHVNGLGAVAVLLDYGSWIIPHAALLKQLAFLVATGSIACIQLHAYFGEDTGSAVNNNDAAPPPPPVAGSGAIPVPPPSSSFSSYSFSYVGMPPVEPRRYRHAPQVGLMQQRGSSIPSAPSWFGETSLPKESQSATAAAAPFSESRHTTNPGLDLPPPTNIAASRSRLTTNPGI